MKSHFIKLTDDYNYPISNFEQIQKLGTLVDGLIPCLDPDLELKHYKKDSLMAQRTYEEAIDEKFIMYVNEFTTPNDLTEKGPFFLDFVPSPDTMSKLYRRMAMIKDPIANLWVGFNVE